MTTGVERTAGDLSDVDLPAIGALLGDASRCRILLALDDGRALPASRLASEAGVTAATASEHLGKLVAGGLLAVQRHGRNRFYRLANADVGRLIEQLGRLAPARPVRSLREGTRAHALRTARSCYDHLAGRVGVAVMDSLTARGHLVATADTAAVTDGPVGAGHDVDYHLAPSGVDFLTGLGVVVPARPVLRYCVDWTEQRHHLAGAAGRVLLARLLELDWLRRIPTGRALRITRAGREALPDTFGAPLAAIVTNP